MFSLADILWTTTKENSFEKAYMRRRRSSQIPHRDWKQHPAHFDYDIEQHPQFRERKKLAKQTCWHWLQLELNCTHRAATKQELQHIPQDARILWLHDTIEQDPRIVYFLGQDRYNTQCVEEIFVSGLATPLYRFRQQEWILIPPWIQVLQHDGLLAFFDLSHPDDMMMLQTLWKGDILAERFVRFQHHPIQNIQKNKRQSNPTKIPKIHRLPQNSTKHHHHHHHHHHHESIDIPERIQNIPELLRLFCTHPPEIIAPDFHHNMTGFALAFAVGHLYETPLMEIWSESKQEDICIDTSHLSFYDLILLVCSALAMHRDVWIQIQDDTSISTKNTAAFLAQHASNLHLPIYLGRNPDILCVTQQDLDNSLHCALWTGGDIKPLLQDILFLEGKTCSKIHSVFVPMSQLELFLDACTHSIQEILDVMPHKATSNTTMLHYFTKRGHHLKIHDISIGILDIAYFSPIHIPACIQVYTFTSLDEIISFLEPWQFVLQTLYIEPAYFFLQTQKTEEVFKIEHLSLLQNLFSKSALVGLLHQRTLQEQFSFVSHHP